MGSLDSVRCIYGFTFRSRIRFLMPELVSLRELGDEFVEDPGVSLELPVGHLE
jgi:hypothetical protein